MSAKNILTHFENIDTEEKAYWLGFLYADGYVNANEDKIELCLAEKDFHHLEKFKNFIGLPNKICYRATTKAYRYSFRSTNCKQDLIKQGCVPKKSLILHFPTTEQVSDALLRHFLRGYFDGDGWFTNTELCFEAGFISSQDFINSFLAKIESFIDVKIDSTVKNVHRENGAKKYSFYSKHDVTVFLDFLYQDSSIYLDRKYEHYLDFKMNGSKYHKT